MYTWNNREQIEEYCYKMCTLKQLPWWTRLFRYLDKNKFEILLMLESLIALGTGIAYPNWLSVSANATIMGMTAIAALIDHYTRNRI